jgi:hypothetical protein
MTSENTVTPSPSQPVSQPPPKRSSSPSGIVESLTQKGPSIADTLIEKAKKLIFPSINGKRSGNSGFTYITISGTPQERGFSHGKLLGERIIIFFITYAFFIWTETGRDVRFFMKMLNDFFKPIVEKKYKECYDEMKGIADGVAAFVKENADLKDHAGESMIKDGKIILHKDSYVNIDNSNVKDGYTDGKVLVDITVDIIFLLNNIVSIDYLYSKLFVLVPKRSDLHSNPMYADFLPDKKPATTLSTKVGGGDDGSGYTETEQGGGELTGFEEGLSGGKSFKELFFGSGDKCSAFMAVGPSYTEKGEAVCAHITFDNFITGQFNTIILYIDTSSSSSAQTTPPQPSSNNILMQTFPGGIWSSTDFFVTSAGFMGTETTIGGFNAFQANAPICVRARKAMEYSKTLDDYVKYLKEDNSGDYANTWYIAKINNNTTTTPTPIPTPTPTPTPAIVGGSPAIAATTPIPNPGDEIMRIELGLEYVNVEKKTDGYFIGFNACYDPRIRNLECINDGFYDIRRHSGARRVRLEQLMRQYKGKINAQIAKIIISDHMDVYTNTELKCSRTVCAHYELDKREYMSQESRPKPYQPRGAVDAKICTSSLCRNMKFLARWGNACGTPFKKTEFCDNHIQWEYQRSFLEDRERQPWVFCNGVNMKEPLEKIEKAIEADPDKTGDGVSSSSGNAARSPSPSRSTASMESSKSKPLAPIPAPIPAPIAAPAIKPAKELVTQPPPNTTHSAHNIQSEHKIDPYHHALLPSNNGIYSGGSIITDNNKEMKEFMKMLKTKSGIKSKTKNTRRNKHNKSK